MVKQKFELNFISRHKEKFPQERIPRVSCELEITEGRLKASFLVENAKLNASKNYPTHESVWGLWDRDVCEIFLSSSQEESQHLPYYEFQVSPFAQYFELKIFEPRKKYDEAFQSGLRVSAKVMTTQKWTSEILIPLKELGLDPSKPIFGNIFACLLLEPQRAYMALNENPQTPQPDFHQPSAFLRLL